MTTFEWIALILLFLIFLRCGSRASVEIRGTALAELSSTRDHLSVINHRLSEIEVALGNIASDVQRVHISTRPSHPSD